MDDDDDLDELLDEVEKKFCHNVSVASKYGKDTDGQRKPSATKPGEPTSSIAEDIDALLEELLEEDHGNSPQPKNEPFSKGPQVEKKLSSQSGGRRCCPVFVGGSSVTNGVGTATSKRNNMPDRQKLRAKLKKRRDFRAYGCQCSWFSSSEPTDLRDQPQLRWVCGKHQD